MLSSAAVTNIVQTTRCNKDWPDEWNNFFFSFSVITNGLEHVYT